MVFGNGGRADKQGNVYENRYLARVLLSIIAEKYVSVVVEPLGENTSICEFYVNEKNGQRTYYQCKGSNNMNDHWTTGDLQRFHLYERIKRLFRSDPGCNFVFVSPFHALGLENLCERARTCLSASEFIENALTNETLRATYQSCVKNFGFDSTNNEHMQEMFEILSRCEFRVYISNQATNEDFELMAGAFLVGSMQAARVLLENYVNDTSSYGKEITVADILNYLSGRDVYAISTLRDERIAPSLLQLNKRFCTSYQAVDGNIFHRSATDKIIREIEEGKSVILHGKAGTGKSGCIRELIHYLEDAQVNYLAVQLDKFIQANTADQFGKELGLPGSPVTCLTLISGAKPSVLILDQLDALRWTVAHSATALDVCKEMIDQAQAMNRYRNQHISVVFSVRTFDYETDSSIQSLFIQDPEHHEGMQWSEVQVGDLTDEEVSMIVGNRYAQLSARVRELIRIPSSLYVWLKLESGKQENPVSSSEELVFSWWNQIQEKYRQAGNNSQSLDALLSYFVSSVYKVGSFAMPRIQLIHYSHELDYLASSGMLITADNMVSFAHQSFLDCFLLKEDLDAYLSGKTLLTIVLTWNSQMPVNRYRLSAFLQSVTGMDQVRFVQESRRFLDSDQIHYYFQAAVFETIGQLAQPDSDIYQFVDDYFTKIEWHNSIFQTVYERHPAFIRHYFEQQNADQNMEEVYSLLSFMRSEDPAFVVSVLRKMLTTEAITQENALSVLGWQITEEADDLFALRMELYRADCSLLSTINYIDLMEGQANHIIDLLDLCLHSIETTGPKHITMGEGKNTHFFDLNFRSIISALLDPLCANAQGAKLSLHAPIDQYNNDIWRIRKHESTLARNIADLVKKSLKISAKNDPEEAIFWINKAGAYNNGISNELALATLFEISEQYSDFVIEWLLDDFDHRIIDCYSNEADYLAICKDIIRKHSPSCSEALFLRLESTIYHWKGDREKHIQNQKYRLENNRSKDHFDVFFPTWGHMQKALLPYLDSFRTSRKTKELIQVLNRNPWVLANDYHAPILSGEARLVISTIHDHVDKLSDRTWLEIISSGKVAPESGFSAKKDKEYYYETSHRSFASELEVYAKKDLTRYVKLLFHFPKDAFPGYYVSVLRCIAREQEHSMDFQLLCKVIRYCKDLAYEDILTALMEVVGEYSEENWPEDIIQLTIDIAAGSLQSADNERRPDGREETTLHDPESVEIATYNCSRAVAIRTIGQLIGEHPEWIELFRSHLEKLAEETDPVICFSLVKTAALIYEVDQELSMTIMRTLAETDLFSICAPSAFWLMSRDDHLLETFYSDRMIEACKSANPRIVLHAAQSLCKTAIITSNEHVFHFLYSHSWRQNEIDAICNIAIGGFEAESYRSNCKEILEHFLADSNDKELQIHRLFSKNGLDIHQDEHLISALLQKCRDINISYTVLEYLEKQDTDISQFDNTVKTVIGSLENVHGWESHYIEDHLIHVVIKLIDRGQNDRRVTESCLSILDEIYRKRILNDSGLSKLLDGAE